MPETTHSIAERTDVLQLPLPALSLLDEDRRRGAACVWGCGTVLTTDTAVDAGERPAADGGMLLPRGCAPCAARAAYRLLWEHARTCDVCRTDPSCPVSVAANRLMREGGL